MEEIYQTHADKVISIIHIIYLANLLYNTNYTGQQNESSQGDL